MRSVEAFHRQHQQRYGFCDTERPVEIVNVRLRMIAAGETYAPAQNVLVPGDGGAACYGEHEIFFDGEFVSSRLYRREALRPGDTIHGPAMITEYTSATVLPAGCSAQVDGFGNLVIAVPEEAHG
jgi:N-methylhydantoinase A